jgi:transcription initiation factor TFIIA small subunit
MNYQLYRRTTLGECLVDSLDDLIKTNQITPQLAMRVLLQFDKSINESLERKLKSKATLKGQHADYRFCDDVWTFFLDNAVLRINDGESITANKLKIVSCNAKRPGAT